MTFEQFYREQHLPRPTDPGCRLLHAIGPPASAIYAGVVVSLQQWWLLLLTPVPTYLFSCLGHLWAGNVTTVFGHPLWSFRGYWKMLAGMLSNRTAPAGGTL